MFGFLGVAGGALVIYLFVLLISGGCRWCVFDYPLLIDWISGAVGGVLVMYYLLIGFLGAVGCVLSNH